MQVYSFNGVKLDRSMKNVLYFATPEARLNYLLDHYTYLIKNAEDKFFNESRLVLKLNADFTARTNYIAIVDNLAIKQIRFYFVDNFTQLTNNNYNVNVVLDVFATYFNNSITVSDMSLINQTNMRDIDLKNYASNASIVSNMLEAGTEEVNTILARDNLSENGFYILLNCHTVNAIGRTFIFKSTNVLVANGSLRGVLNAIGDLKYKDNNGVEQSYIIDGIYYMPLSLLDYTLSVAPYHFGSAEIEADLLFNDTFEKVYANIQNNVKKRIAIKYGRNIDYLNTNLTEFDFNLKILCGSGVVRILAGVNNEYEDVSEKFELCVYTDAFSQYQAFNKSVMNYQNYSRKITLATNLVKTGLSTAASFASGNMFAQANAISGVANNVIGSITNYDLASKGEAAKFADMRGTPVAYGSTSSGYEIANNGLTVVNFIVSNHDDVDRITNLYGYAFTTTSIEAPNNATYIDAASKINFRFFKYEYIYFANQNFNNDILMSLTNLFLSGIRIWYKPNKFLTNANWYDEA